MPLLTRCYIKSAFAYLIAALVIAAIIAFPDRARLPRFVAYLYPIYIHLFLVGWVTEMIFGVIYWMFPIITRENPRGNHRLAWVSFGLLNLGLLMRVIGEPLVGLTSQPQFGYLLLFSALMQWLAILSFTWVVWPRIKDRYRGG